MDQENHLQPSLLVRPGDEASKSFSLTHRSFSLPAEGGIRCFPLGTTELIQAKLSQEKSHLQTGSDPMLPLPCSSSAIPEGKVTLGLGSEAGFDPGYLCSALVNKNTVVQNIDIQQCAFNLGFQRQQ